MLTLKVLVLLAFLSAVWAYFKWLERRNLYFPVREMEWTPAEAGLTFDEVFFTTSDGLRLHGWFVPTSRERSPTVLFCHGNGGNVSHLADIIDSFHNLGWSAFVFDYRGYGRSAGKPSEFGLYLDAEAAYRWLTEQKGIAAHTIVIYGHSLGAAVGTELATRVEAAGLVLQSAFTSAADLAKEIYPFLPVRLIVGNKFDTASKIARVNKPLLIIHSREDDLVRFEHAEALFAKAAEPKQLLKVHGLHNEFLLDDARYAEALRAFVRSTAKTDME